MEKLLEFLAKNVSGSEDIEVVSQEAGELTIYTITAPKEVMGLLIGKDGRMVRAIRTIAKARAIIDKESIAVKIEEKS